MTDSTLDDSTRRVFFATAGLAIGSLVPRTLRAQATTRAISQGGPTAAARSEPAVTTRLVLALQSFLDSKTEALVRKTWRALTDANIPNNYYLLGARPHITTGSWQVAAFDEDWMGRLADFCQSHARVPVRLVPRWNGQRGVNLIPDKTAELLAYHSHVHKAFPDIGKFQREQDRPGQWRPHLTTARWREDQSAQAREICEPLAQPIDAEIEYLGWVTFGQSNRFLATFPFTGQRT